MVEVATLELNGGFKICELAEKTGQGRDAITLAQRWGALGYLSPVQRNAHGHQLGRKVTEKLCAVELPPVAGIGISRDQADHGSGLPNV